MALPTTGSGRHLLVELETEVAGTYAAICGFKDRSLKATRSAADVSVQDCDDPDIVVVERDVGPMSWEISGSGVATKEGVPTLLSWWESGSAQNVRVKLSTATGWVQYTGAALLTDVEFGGNIDGDKVSLSATIVSTGLWTRGVVA